MTIQHFAFTVYQHVNPNNAADAANGFYACYQPSLDSVTPAPGSKPVAVPASKGAANPYVDLASAQAFIATLQTTVAAANAAVADPTNPVSNTLVYGPVFV
jgi:hypothetical protein